MEFGGGEELGEDGEAVLVEVGVGHKGIMQRVRAVNRSQNNRTCLPVGNEPLLFDMMMERWISI